MKKYSLLKIVAIITVAFTMSNNLLPFDYLWRDNLLSKDILIIFICVFKFYWLLEHKNDKERYIELISMYDMIS